MWAVAPRYGEARRRQLPGKRTSSRAETQRRLRKARARRSRGGTALGRAAVLAAQVCDLGVEAAADVGGEIVEVRVQRCEGDRAGQLGGAPEGRCDRGKLSLVGVELGYGEPN
jgi:hypothetical protein